jgi:uncharacterized protein
MASTTTSGPAGERVRRVLVRCHPVVVFSLFAFGLGWPLLTVYTVTPFAHTTVGVLFTYVALLGPALLVTWWADGVAGVRALLRRLLVWRFSTARWLVVLLSMPALTVAAAGLSGTLRTPDGGWAAAGTAYLFATVVTGALAVNLAEETAWAGVVQTRLTARHGLVRAALLTAPLFVAMHLPLQFEPGWTWGSVAEGVIALLVAAPLFRYVVGDLLDTTGGSLLAVGLWHASFNASGQIGFPDGWQSLAALVVLAAAMAVTRRLRCTAPATPATHAAPAATRK